MWVTLKSSAPCVSTIQTRLSSWQRWMSHLLCTGCWQVLTSVSYCPFPWSFSVPGSESRQRQDSAPTLVCLLPQVQTPSSGSTRLPACGSQRCWCVKSCCGWAPVQGWCSLPLTQYHQLSTGHLSALLASARDTLAMSASWRSASRRLQPALPNSTTSPRYRWVYTSYANQGT